jgi:hypothetical protein
MKTHLEILHDLKSQIKPSIALDGQDPVDVAIGFTHIPEGEEASPHYWALTLLEKLQLATWNRATYTYVLADSIKDRVIITPGGLVYTPDHYFAVRSIFGD